MGNSDSKNLPPRTFSPDIEIITNKHSSQFGEVKLVKDKKTGQEMCLKEIVVHGKKDFEAQLKYYNARLNNPHPNLVNLIGYTTERQVIYCSEYYKIDLYLDSLSKTLEDSLREQTMNNELFSEVELQLITEHLVTILSEFQKKDISHGDICLASVYVTEEAYKLCDPNFEGQKGNNAISKAILIGAKPLLAPELVKQIPKEDVEIRTNKFKADVFSLGATVLSLATLKRSEELYNYQDGTIRMDLLEKRIREAEDSYSPLFCGILRDMLTINEQMRPNFLDLNERLNIGETIKLFNDHNKLTVPSHAKVPYVKIAGEVIRNSPVQSPTGSPLKTNESRFEVTNSSEARNNLSPSKISYN